MNLIEWPYYWRDFLGSQGFSETLPARFWSKIVFTSTCWLWTGSQTDCGYGMLGRGTAGSGCVLAHIVSWILHFGPVPPGMQVLHDCDRPPCCRPDHLWIGTQKDNIRDCWHKGRQGVRSLPRNQGQFNPRAKLTLLEIEQIRGLARSGLTQAAIASQFGVDRSAISRITSGKRWLLT